MPPSPRHGTNVPRALGTDAGAARGGKFDAMFPRFRPGRLEDDAIEELLDCIDDSFGGGNINLAIPAGYTYLGQFIDHDLTFDPTPQLATVKQSHAAVSLRSPRLDLDSLYGAGPDDQPYLYEWTTQADRGVKLLVGSSTSQDGTLTVADLPRNDQGLRVDRRPPQRREPDRLAAAPAVHLLSQSRRRPHPQRRAEGRASCFTQRGRSCAGITSGSSRTISSGGSSARRWPTPCCARAPGRPSSASSTSSPAQPFIPRRVLGRRLPLRAQHGANSYALNDRAEGRGDPTR